MVAAGSDSVALAFLFAAIGSVAMGSYPVPIKAKSVLQANVHPLIFQCYKSFWVFACGWAFVLVNLARHRPWYVFSYWPILGAAAWIPSGLGTIAAVPRLGVGMAIVLSTGCSASLQFMVGQLVGEKMKWHGPPGHEYVLAPYYLFAVVLGMAGLVLSPTLRCKGRNAREDDGAPLLQQSIPRQQLVAGIVCAVLAGVFSALQFAVLTIGKRVERPSCTDCWAYDHYQDQFDTFGSYMVSFGIGAGSVTTLYVGLFAGKQRFVGEEMPRCHFNTLKTLGSIAGLCWVCGNVFQSAAVSTGGSSVMGPANQAIQLITSGAWGLLYYREVKELRRILCWILSAAWTVAFVVLLGREKE